MDIFRELLFSLLLNIEEERAAAAAIDAARSAEIDALRKEYADVVDILWKKESTVHKIRQRNDHLERILQSQGAELDKLNRRLAHSMTVVQERDKHIGNLLRALQEERSNNAKLKLGLVTLEETQALLRADNEWQRLAPLSLNEHSQPGKTRALGRIASMISNAKYALRSAKNIRPSLLFDYSLVRRSGLFDAKFYLHRYPDVLESRTKPLFHYLTCGAREGRNPHPLYDTTFYLERYPEVAMSGMNPLVHYLVRGWQKNFDPNPLFDSTFYKSKYPNVETEPLAHYLAEGWRLGYNPNPFFDSSYYLASYADVKECGINPLAHYLLAGSREGRNPHLLFDASYYLNCLGLRFDVRYPLEKGNLAAFYHHVHLRSQKDSNNMNPLEHYIRFGASQGRNPHPLFEAEYYLNRYPDVKESGLNPLLDFLTQPIEARRQPHPLFDPEFYLEKYPDILNNGMYPLDHFLLYGAAEKRDPGPAFDSSFYLDLYDDVKQSGQNPLVHYVMHGAQEKRKTQSPQFAILGEAPTNGKAVCLSATEEAEHGNASECKINDDSDSGFYPIPPPELDFVGGHSFREIGQTFKKIFIEQGGLKPHERILDVGCGIGRMALPLTNYMDSSGEYSGFDIVKVGIDWCNENITPRFPNFRFKLFDIYNKEYNPTGVLSAESCKFPYESDYFDLVILISVFTHLLPVAMENYLCEITRVLKPGGRCLITYFLLNSASRALMSAGSSTYQFGSALVPYALLTEDSPEAAIAFDEGTIRQLYDKCSIEVIEPIHFGSWCGRSEFLHFQDVVVARKRAIAEVGLNHSRLRQAV